ncbi:MAG: putative nonstructural protein [Macrobrachium rosenbergii virus 2]|nr:MAG: putative nonstructural protein [Macrobrachium rosenbergii virus 2]
MAGRKKFGTAGLIANMKTRKFVDQDGFTHVLSGRLRQLIGTHLQKKFLIVNGTPIKFDFDYTLDMVLDCFSNMFPIDKEVSGRKLYMIPCFHSLNYGNCNGSISKTYRHTPREMLEKYNEAEKIHKLVEGRHHPDSPKFETTMDSSFEVVFDVYSSLLREVNSRTAFQKILSIFRTPKFSKLDPLGVYAAFMHLMIRGVANADLFRVSAQWRKKPEELIEKLCKDYENGIANPTEIASYKRETSLHANAVRQEMKRARFSVQNHDYSKFWNPMIWYYSWYWGCFKQMTPIAQHRYISGCDVVFGFPTMFSSVIGSGVENGLDRASPIIRESIDYAAETISTKVSESLKDVSREILDQTRETSNEVLTNQIQYLGGQFRDAIQEFFNNAESFRDRTFSEIAERAEPYFQTMVNSGDDITRVFGMLTNQVDYVIEGVKKAFIDPLGLGEAKIDAASILEAFKYFIFFLNVNDTFLKGICLVQILRSLGILQIAFKYMKELFRNFITVDEVETDDSAIPGHPTFDVESWVSILATPFKLVRYVVVTLASMAQGAALSVPSISSLLQYVAKPMREFHFIGGGILGIQRIITAAKDLYKSVSEWILKNIFKRTPEKDILAQRVAKWILKTRYFTTEAGINAIRANRKVLEQAEKLFGEGQALLAELAEPSPNADRLLLGQIHRYWRNSQQLCSLIHRIRAASTFEPTMFHIQFVGQAGIGKSTLTKRFVHDVLKTVWDEDEVNSFWSYNPNLEYFDGYAGQKIMMVDDMFRFNDPKHLTSLIGLVTNVPVILPMANLEDKGIQMTSKILVSSTNTAYPIGKDIYCMEAVYRRRHLLVHVRCDERVIDKSSQQFSQVLFEQFYPGQNASEFPHLKFDLIKPVPLNTDRLDSVEDSEAFRSGLISISDFLKANNQSIISGRNQLDADLYFSTTSAPPSPLGIPCEEWSYHQFLANAVLRYHSFTGMEAQYNSRRKFAHVQRCLSEIDQIVDQEFHIPDGAELPTVRLVENLFSDLLKTHVETHEEGYEDPVAARTMDGEELSPELSDISFDDISFEVINSDEGITTADDDYDMRVAQARLRRRRNGAVRGNNDPIANMLRHKVHQGKKYLPVTPLYTMWQAFRAQSGGDSRFTRFIDCRSDKTDSIFKMHMQYARQYAAHYTIGSVADVHPIQQGHIERLKDIHNKFKNWTSEFYCSANTSIPKDPLFREEDWGKSTGLSLFFLQRMKYFDTQWYLDVDDFWWDMGFQYGLRAEDNEAYPVPVNLDLFMSQLEHFRLFSMQFESFTFYQQEKLVSDAQWRYKFLGYYTTDKIRRDMRGTWKSLPAEFLHYVSKPFFWIGSQIYKFFEFLYPIIVMGCLYATVYTLARLIIPAQPTSKYLHRGPPTGIIYKGRTTAEYANVNGPMSMASSFLRRNSRQIEIVCKAGIRRCQAVASGSFLILNKHCVEGINDEIISILINNPTMECPTEYLVPSEHIICDPNNDLAVIYSRMFPAARDITRFLMSDSEYARLEVGGELIFLSKEDQEVLIERQCGFRKFTTPCRMLTTNGKLYSMERAVVVGGTTCVGKSGSLVMLPNHQAAAECILGIQAWQLKPSYGDEISIQVITKELLENLTSQANSFDQLFSKFDIDDEEYVEGTTGLFTNEAIPICNDEPPVGMIGKTQFKRSPIANLMDKDGMTSLRVPAALTPYDSRLYHGTKIHPLGHSVNKYFRGNIKPFDLYKMRQIYDDFVSHLTFTLDTEDFTPLNFKDIITGTRDEGSNPMNLKSSPGIPYVYDKTPLKGKSRFFTITEEGECEILDESIEQQMIDLEDSLADGQIPLSVSYDFPKDELRPEKKALGSETSPPKTRSVTCMNMLYILIWRKYTLRFWASMHRMARGDFPFCPGINPEGPDWTRAFFYLNQHPNAVDFDVSNWDGFMPPDLFYTAFEVMTSVMGYFPGDREYAIIHAIGYEVMNSYIKYGNIIYQKQRGLVSGFPGTAEINSLVHYMLLYYIYLQLSPSIYSNFNSFQNLTSKLVYGDDVILTVSDEIVEWFNGISIAAVYTDIGYPVTAASKDATILASKPLIECQFLKSTWYHYSNTIKLRKMDLSVAYDLLYWERAKEHPVDQFYSNCYDAARIAMGHGRSTCDKFIKQLNNWLKSAKLPIVELNYAMLIQDHMGRYYE